MNKISIKTKGTAGDVEIPPGDYVVTAVPERSSIQLSGHGKDYLVAAVNRRTAASERARRTALQFYSMGGGNWTICVTMPKRGEFVAFIKLEKQKS